VDRFPLRQLFDPRIGPALQVNLVPGVGAAQFPRSQLKILVGHAHGTPAPDLVIFKKFWDCHLTSEWGKNQEQPEVCKKRAIRFYARGP
jgi:hypothetical protein